MEQRFKFDVVCPDGFKAMRGLNAYVHGCGLDMALVELVKIRVSQINGCAFCISMHVPLARKAGATDDQLHLLATWWEAPVYDARQRAALAWGESLTRIDEKGVTDESYRAVREQFSEKETADLAMAVVEINAWNRLMVMAGTPVKVSTPAAGG